MHIIINFHFQLIMNIAKPSGHSAQSSSPQPGSSKDMSPTDKKTMPYQLPVIKDIDNKDFLMDILASSPAVLVVDFGLIVWADTTVEAEQRYQELEDFFEIKMEQLKSA